VCVARGGGVDSAGSGQGPVAGCCECGDEPSGSGATELVQRSGSHGDMYENGCLVGCWAL
jgi:hypothetical protein